MRILCFALLLLNVAFFGWAHWIDVPRAGTPVAADAGVAKLDLAGSSAVATSATTAASAVAPAGAAGRCRSLGPFAGSAEADAAAERLRAGGHTPRARSAEGSTPDGFWVYIAGQKDQAAQKRSLARLSAAGIRDAAAMTGDESDRVSVGVFADQARAVHRAEQVRSLGFEPVLGVHQKTLTQQWLDVDLKADEADPSFTAAADSASSSGATADASPAFIDCPAAVPSGG